MKENVYPYSEFKKRRDKQEMEKKKIISLLDHLHKKHFGTDPKDVA